MLEPDFLTRLFQSESFQAALIIVTAGSAISVVSHILLPARRSRRMQQRLAVAGLAQGEQPCSFPGSILTTQSCRLIPLSGPELLESLRSVIEPQCLAVEMETDRLLLRGDPRLHWNVNLIRPQSFSQAEFHATPTSPGACRVEFRAVLQGYWRSCVILGGAVAVAGLLSSLGQAGRASASGVVFLLSVFGLFFSWLRLSALRTEVRTWMEGSILEACVRKRAAPSDAQAS